MTLISELLRSRVIDATGADLGSVDDVRLVQDGPVVEGFGSLLRVAGLVVGRGGLAVRLGYHRHQVKGPALVKAIVGRLERRAHYVSWEQVETWADGTVRLGVPAAEVARVDQAY